MVLNSIYEALQVCASMCKFLLNYLKKVNTANTKFTEKCKLLSPQDSYRGLR